MTWPADYPDKDRFASCLLMPREMVKRACHEWRGDMEPIYLGDLRAEVGNQGTDGMVLENAVRPLATAFQASPEAMRIRTEGMEGTDERVLAIRRRRFEVGFSDLRYLRSQI